jgi:hypothetical protein
VARWLGPPTEREAEFVLEEAGCGCGFISEQAPNSPDVWPMTAEHRERLANAVERFVGSIPGDVRFAAMWASDPVRITRDVTLDELVEAVRGGHLGTNTEYRVAARPAS